MQLNFPTCQCWYQLLQAEDKDKVKDLKSEHKDKDM